MTPYLVGGVVIGSIYAIATLGLLVTYTSSRIFNFAHGAIAYFIAVTFHQLAVGYGWSPLLAAAVSVLVVAPLVGLFLWAVLFRRLADAPTSVRLVSTIGLWVAIPPLTRLIYGREEIFDRTGIGPTPAHNYKLLGVAIDSNQVIVLVAAVAIAVLLTALMRLTPYGLSMRATVDSPRLAATSGIDTRFVGATSWMIGTGLAGLAGVLLAPLRGYLEFQFTFLLLGAFAACVIARMHSLVLGFAGSMLIGLLQSLAQSKQADDLLTTFLSPDSVILKGLDASIPFILMIIFLIAYRDLGREHFSLDRSATPSPDPPPPASRSWARRAAPAALVFAVVLILPELVSGLWLAVIAKGLALGIAFLSYTVVTGEGGMISLCQVTLAGIGGAVVADLATNAGWPVLPAVLVAALVCVPIGLLAALPSLRLGDLYLALATLALAVLVQNTFFQAPSVNNYDSGVVVPRPMIGSVGFGDDRAFFYLLAGLFVLVAILVVNLKRSTTGLVLTATRSSEAASATVGISVVRAKLAAFGVSAFIAGVGGGLYVTYAQRSQPAQAFNVLIGVVWLAVVVTWGVRSPIGALLAGLSFTVMPQLFSEHLSGEWLEVPTILFGLGAIGLARDPRGIVAHSASRRRARHRRRAAHGEPTAPGPPTAPDAMATT